MPATKLEAGVELRSRMMMMMMGDAFPPVAVAAHPLIA